MDGELVLDLAIEHPSLVDSITVVNDTPQKSLDPPVFERLSDIRVPALIINRSLDHAETLLAGQLLAEQIPGAIQHTIDGTAYVPNLEKPVEVTERLLGFLAG